MMIVSNHFRYLKTINCNSIVYYKIAVIVLFTWKEINQNLQENVVQ